MIRVSIIVLLMTTKAIFAVPISSIINGGFEAPLSGSWNTLGSLDTRQFLLGQTATEGQEFAYAATATSGMPSPATVEQTLNLPSGTFDAVVPGDFVLSLSVGWQQVQVTAGDVISFDWAFATNPNPIPTNSPGPDYGFVLIDDAVAPLAWQDDVSLPTSNDNFKTTGWHSFQQTIATTGVINIGFGATDVTTGSYPSYLMVDNFVLVPEPTSMLLMSLGISILLTRRGRVARVGLRRGGRD